MSTSVNLAAKPSAGRQDQPTIMLAVADDDGLVGIASVIRALELRGCFRHVVVHTGTVHPSFASDVALPAVDHELGVHATGHAERTADTMTTLDRLLAVEPPDVMLVTGDEDATLAAALTAAKRNVAVAHLGSGMRCCDWSRPDEVNRSLIDGLADTLFPYSDDGKRNLLGEGVPPGRIHTMGNPRIDTVHGCHTKARCRAAWELFGAKEHDYTLVALARPNGPDPAGRLGRIAGALHDSAEEAPVLFLMPPGDHPTGFADDATALLAAAGVRCVGPLGYLESLSLTAGAGAIISDLGTVQDDASALGVPCYTPASTTARRVTLTHGTNVLLGDDAAAISRVRPSRCRPTRAAIPLWDGRAGKRVADRLVAHYALVSACPGGSARRA